MSIPRIMLNGLYSKYGTNDLWFSEERGIKEGSVRIIQGKVYYASSVVKRTWFRKDFITWSDIEITGLTIKEK